MNDLLAGTAVTDGAFKQTGIRSVGREADSFPVDLGLDIDFAKLAQVRD